MSKWLKFSLAATVAGISGLSLSGTAQAFTAELSFTDPITHQVFDSGWSYSFDNRYLNNIAPLVFRGQSDNTFFFEKDVVFDNSAAAKGVEITFTKTSADAKTLVINDENLTNQTGTDWTGFQMVLSSASPQFMFSATNASPGTIGDFNIDPFTTFAFTNNSTVLEVGGGTLANGETWHPGAKSNSGLAIVLSGAGDNGTFTLKEIPVVIPLPAAAWTGLSTLLGLGFLGVAKRGRKLLA